MKISNTNKPLILFSTPRAGSTIFLNSIASQMGIREIGEFFCPTKKIEYNQCGYFCVPHVEKKPPEIKYKLDIFQNLPSGYIAKIFPEHFLDQAGKEIFSYLIDEYHFLCLERRNKLNQIWSFGWAQATGEWTNSIPKNLEQNSVLYRPEWFNSITKKIQRFQTLLPQLKSYDLYFYEDMDFKITKSSPKKISYPIDPSSLFQNKKKIIEQYRKWIKQDKYIPWEI